jgi:predicted ATPase/class 3 adenylate cyclase
MAALTSPPLGLLTYLFTDVEGSTRLWAADTEGTARSFELHNALVHAVVEANNGFIFGFAGDGFRASFVEATEAVAAAVGIQDGLAAAAWGSNPPLSVRIGLHTGVATVSGNDYYGPVINTAARVEDAGNGGQILMSPEVVSAIGDVGRYDLLWLGEHRLKDISDPVGIYQLGVKQHRPLRVVNPRLSNLPNLGDRLIGRDALVNRVRADLETKSLVTLTGSGGCGKTRLAIEAAHQELPNRSDGCYFADLISVTSAEGLAPFLARAVRLGLSGGDPMRQIVDHLAGRDALLVLDNCEHLIEPCAEFAQDLMGRAGKTVILATSRERLSVNGEQVVQVTPLELNSNSGGPAVEFFAQRAAQADPDFQVTQANLPEVIELCRKLDGMPLALELAAARMAVLGVKELSARMEDRLLLLSGTRSGAKGKRQTIQATLDWSYQLLNHAERSFFRRVGVFIGPFSLEAATAVAGDGDEFASLDLLQSLVAKSLISIEDHQSSGRFRLLETVRYYASDLLDRESELGIARDRHLTYYHELASTRDWLEGSDVMRARDLTPHWPNISSALEWATATDSWLEAGEIALGSFGMWTNTVSPSIGVTWLETLTEPVETLDVELGQWLGHHHAMLCLQLDDFETVHQIFAGLSVAAVPKVRTQALAMHAYTRNRSDPGLTLRLLAEGDQMVAEQSLGIDSQLTLCWARGSHSLYDGDYESARSLFGETFDYAQQLGVRNTHFYIAGLSYAATQFLTGRARDALATLDDEDWSESVWDSSAVIRAVCLLDLDRAPEAAEEIVRFSYEARRGRLSRMANDALVAWAALAVHQGENERAWDLFQQAITPRTPLTIGLAEGLASRIGKSADLRRLHRERLVPLGQLDATESLSNEILRIKKE